MICTSTIKVHIKIVPGSSVDQSALTVMDTLLVPVGTLLSALCICATSDLCCGCLVCCNPAERPFSGDISLTFRTSLRGGQEEAKSYNWPGNTQKSQTSRQRSVLFTGCWTMTLLSS